MNTFLLNAVIAQAAGGANETTWMPVQASTVAADTDWAFYFIYWLCIFFFVLIMAAMGYFMFAYKASPGRKTSPVKGHHGLEIFWSVIPSLLLLGIFWVGFKDWMTLNVPPEDSLEIRVTGKKWSWSYAYPRFGLAGENTLVVPQGQNVKLIMSSQDVLHSFYIPAFRVKRDVIPNRYTVLWFNATKTGKFQVFCTEYCGQDHSRMLSSVVVKTPEEFQDWVDNGGGDPLDPDYGKPQPPVVVGEKAYVQACAACHSVDGTPRVGPSFKGLFGKTEEFADGSSVQVDDNYLRQSIMEPNAKIVKGFAPAMPSFKGQLKDAQVDGLIEYIKTLK
ncbi:MAG: cytochrome c oxidase subunit 2 [Myxococcota bacterium]|nr:cytochrome c oxidase subunit 2 [Myxococcota bacterium]